MAIGPSYPGRGSRRRCGSPHVRAEDESGEEDGGSSDESSDESGRRG